MLITALCLAACAAALGAWFVRNTVRNLPHSNQDWVWY